MQDIVSNAVTDVRSTVLALASDGSVKLKLSFETTSPGQKSVMISWCRRPAKPFTLSFVAPPSSSPRIEKVEPGSGICDGSVPTRIVLKDLRKLERNEDLRLQVGSSSPFDGSSEAVVRIDSSLLLTSIEFKLPSRSTFGTVAIQVWHMSNSSQRVTVPFECIDPARASLDYVVPQVAYMNEAVTVLVSVRNFHSGSETNVFLFTEGSVSARSVSVSQEGATSLLEIQVESARAGVFSMSLAPCVEYSFCASKNVTVDLEFRDPSEPRVLSFDPVTEFVYGQTQMEIMVQNLPVDTASDLFVELESNISVASVNEPSPGSFVVIMDIPPAVSLFSPDEQVLLPSLHSRTGSFVLRFPFGFRYRPAPQPTIVRMAPASAPILSPSPIRVVVQDFPRVRELSQIVAGFSFPDNSYVTAEVISFSRDATGQVGSSVQHLNIDIRTPQGSKVREGNAMLRLAHSDFAGVVAVDAQSRFSFYDPTLPAVYRLESSSHFGESAIMVPMSVATEVSVSLSNVPSSVTSSQIEVQISRAAVPFTVVSMDRMQRVARLACDVQPSNTASSLRGLVVFGRNKGVQCSSDCCADSTCAAKCAVKTACFTVASYDDAKPSATILSDASGPSSGLNAVRLRISNFPVVQASSEVHAYFRDERHPGSVVVTSSDASSTTLSVISPMMGIGSAAQLAVDVVVAPRARADKSVTFKYTYLAVQPSVTSASPSAASSTGGQVVFVAVSHFRHAAVWVLFGDVILPDSDVTVFDASSDGSSLVSFVTPSTDPGEFQVRVTPRGCTAPCQRALVFDFIQLDPSSAELRQPIPSGAPYQQAQMQTVTVVSFPEAVEASGISVSFVSSDNSGVVFTVSDIGLERSEMDNVALLGIPHPSILPDHLGLYDVVIRLTEEGREQELKLKYELYDGTAMRIKSRTATQVATTSVVYGRRYAPTQGLSVLIANFPQQLGPAQVVAMVDDAKAALVSSVQDVASCGQEMLDCDRTQVSLDLPAFDFPGEKVVTIVPGSGTAGAVTFVVEYVPPCNFESFCSEDDLLVDVKKLADSPAIACDIEYCIEASEISDPIVRLFSPSDGPVSGGTLITVEVEDLAAFSASEVQVEVGSGASRVQAQVVSFVQDAGATLKSSKGTLVVRSPSFSTNVGEMMFRINVRIGHVVRGASFVFEYLAAITANTVVRTAYPLEIYEGETASVFCEVANVPRLRHPFDASQLRMQFDRDDNDGDDGGDNDDGVAATIVSSDIATTAFTFNTRSDWPVGRVVVRVFSAQRGPATAGMVELRVLPQPEPVIDNWFPKSGRVGSDHAVILTVSHLDPLLDMADVTLGFVFANGTSVALALDYLQPLSDASCLRKDCMQYQMQTTIRAGQSIAAAGMQGAANISIEVLGWLSTVAFDLEARGEASIELVEPSSIAVAASSADVSVTVLLRNFPSAGCGASAGCAAEAREGQLEVQVAAVTAKVQAAEDVDGMLALTLVAPPLGTAGIKHTTVFARDSTAALVSVSFALAYLVPAPSIDPVDGPVTGGTAVTVTVLGWGDASLVSSPSDVLVHLNGVEALVLEVVSAVSNPLFSSLSVLVLTPPALVAGSVHGEVGLSSGVLSAGFKFDYFLPPVVASIVPARATTQGVTTSSDGRSVLVSLHDFPSVSSPDDVLVSVGGVECGAACRIIDVQNAHDRVDLRIEVPASAPGKTSISLLFVGMETFPTDGESVSHSEKRAVGELTYFVPTIEIQAASWCSACAGGRTCMVNGRCSGGAQPVSAAAPRTGGGAMTLLVANAPGIEFNAIDGTISASDGVTVQFGTFGIAVVDRVAYQDGVVMALELAVPSVPATVQVVTAELAVRARGAQLASVASVKVSFFGETQRLWCQGGCRGSATGGGQVVVFVENLPLSPQQRIMDQVHVRFGSMSAAQISTVASNATVIQLLVTIPAGVCSSCTFVSGKATVPLTVQLRSDPSLQVFSQFSFWKAPQIVSARFDSIGALVTVAFDQATDRAGMDRTDRNCSRALTAASLAPLGGEQAKCTWAADDMLRVQLGADAYGVPLAGPGVRVGGGVRSKNGISAGSWAWAAIGRPALVMAPEVRVKGPTSIDACSSLEVEAIASNPRPLTFQWRCDNDDGLNQALLGLSGPSLYLGPGTMEMSELDKTYSISVTATDFLGTRSRAASIAVRKTPFSAPSFSLTPAILALYRDEVARVRVEASFSRCPTERNAMEFEWRQVSGPPLPEDLDVLATPLSQLVIPAGVLQAGEEYVLAARVAMSKDAAETSESMMRLVVRRRALVASIAGGSSLHVSSASRLSLDAASSTDPDEAQGVSSQGLFYTWSCHTVGSTAMRSSCRDSQGLLLQLPAATGASLVQLPGGTLPVSPDAASPYYFTVTVSKPSKTPATFTMPVFVVEEAIPSATIASESGQLQAEGSFKVNADERVVLHGACGAAGGRVAWSLDPHLDLTDVSKAKIVDSNRTLVLLAGASLVPGSAYQVSFLCEHMGAVGSARAVLTISMPPQGRACEACRVGSGDECIKAGVAILDTFKVSCMNWVHSEDMPLQFQFGYSGTFDGEFQEVMFDWNLSPTLTLLLPSGAVTVHSRVRSSFGTQSEWMHDEVVVESLGTGGRRLLSMGGLGVVAVDMMVPELQRGRPEVVNRQMSTVLVEADQQLSDSAAGVEEGRALKSSMLSVLTAAVDLAPLDAGYVCETLAVIALLVGRPEHQTRETVAGTTRLVAELVAASNVESMPEACAQVAIDILTANLAAHHRNLSCAGAVNGASVGAVMSDVPVSDATMEDMRKVMVHVLAKTASALQSGEAVPMRASASLHTMLHTTLASLQGITLQHYLGNTRGMQSYGGGDATVAVSLPDSLVRDSRKRGSAAMDVLFGASAFPPILNGHEPISPIVRMVLLGDDESEIDVVLRQPAVFTIPIKAGTSCHTGEEPFTPAARCLSLTGATYSAYPCSTQQTSAHFVRCSCSGLADVLVVEDSSSLVYGATPSSIVTPRASTLVPLPDISTTAVSRNSDVTAAGSDGSGSEIQPETTVPAIRSHSPPLITAMEDPDENGAYPGYVTIQIVSLDARGLNHTLDNEIPQCHLHRAAPLPWTKELFLAASANISAMSCGVEGGSGVVRASFTVVLAPQVEVRCTLMAASLPGAKLLAGETALASSIPVDPRRVRSFSTHIARRSDHVGVAFRVLVRSGEEAAKLQQRLASVDLRSLIADALELDASEVSAVQVFVFEPGEGRPWVPANVPSPGGPHLVPIPPEPKAEKGTSIGLILMIAGPLVVCVSALVFGFVWTVHVEKKKQAKKKLVGEQASASGSRDLLPGEWGSEADVCRGMSSANGGSGDKTTTWVKASVDAQKGSFVPREVGKCAADPNMIWAQVDAEFFFRANEARGMLSLSPRKQPGMTVEEIENRIICDKAEQQDKPKQFLRDLGSSGVFQYKTPQKPDDFLAHIEESQSGSSVRGGSVCTQFTRNATPDDGLSCEEEEGGGVFERELPPWLTRETASTLGSVSQHPADHHLHSKIVLTSRRSQSALKTDGSVGRIISDLGYTEGVSHAHPAQSLQRNEVSDSVQLQSTVKFSSAVWGSHNIPPRLCRNKSQESQEHASQRSELMALTPGRVKRQLSDLMSQASDSNDSAGGTPSAAVSSSFVLSRKPSSGLLGGLSPAAFSRKRSSSVRSGHLEEGEDKEAGGPLEGEEAGAARTRKSVSFKARVVDPSPLSMARALHAPPLLSCDMLFTAPPPHACSGTGIAPAPLHTVRSLQDALRLKKTKSLPAHRFMARAQAHAQSPLAHSQSVGAEGVRLRASLVPAAPLLSCEVMFDAPAPVESMGTGIGESEYESFWSSRDHKAVVDRVYATRVKHKKLKKSWSSRILGKVPTLAK